MSVVGNAPGDPARGVEVSRDRASLAAIKESACAVAIWQRQIPAGVQTWQEQLDPVFDLEDDA